MTLKSDRHPNHFDGDARSQKDILIHAIIHLLQTDYLQANQMFPNYRSDSDQRYIDSVLQTATEIFSSRLGGYYHQYKIIPTAYKAIAKTSPLQYVQEYLIEQGLLEEEKSANREKLWYETAEARKRFEDYPRVIRNEAILKWVAIISAVVSLISLLVSLNKK